MSNVTRIMPLRGFNWVSAISLCANLSRRKRGKGMQIRCTQCNAKGSVPTSALGKKVLCPKCGARFSVAPELSFSHGERREGARVNAVRLSLDFGVAAGMAIVRDLTPESIGFEPAENDKEFAQGDVFAANLLEDRRVVLRNVQVRVTRTNGGTYGGVLLDLKEHQALELMHLILRQRLLAGGTVEPRMDARSLELKNEGFI